MLASITRHHELRRVYGAFSSLSNRYQRSNDKNVEKTYLSEKEAAGVKKSLTDIARTVEINKSLAMSNWREIGTTLAKCRSPDLMQAAQKLVLKPILLQSPIGIVHNEVIRILLNLGLLDDVIAMAKSDTFPLNNRNLSRIVGACARSTNKMLNEGNELYELALKQGTVPLMSTYHSLFILCAKSNDHVRLQKIIQHMSESGIVFDAICHGILLRMECRAGRFDDALARCKQLNDDGITLLVGHMNEFLDAMITADYYDEIVPLFEAVQAKIEDKGWGRPTPVIESNLPLNVISYNIMIKACGKEHRMDEAFKWYESMKSKGLKPTTVTINTMLHGVFHGKFRSINPTKVYTGLVGAGALAGAAIMSSDFSESMGAVAITTTVLASLATGIYVNPFGVKKAIYPNESGQREPIPQAILRRLDEEEHIGRLMFLWQELLGYGLQPDPGTFDILVRTCIRKRHPELAAKALLDPNNINSIVSRRKAKGAKYNFELNLEATIRLLQALVAQNLLPLVDQIFDLAAATKRFQDITSRQPGGGVHYALGSFQTPKVTAIVLSKLLEPYLTSMPKHSIQFEVQNCHAVLDILDAIYPDIRALFVMEDVHGTGHGLGALVINRQRLVKYFEAKAKLHSNVTQHRQ